MDDLTDVVPVPVGGRIFDRVVADCDNKVRGVEKPVARLVGELTDSAPKIFEKVSGNGASSLKGPYHRKMILPNEVSKGSSVSRFTCQ